MKTHPLANEFRDRAAQCIAWGAPDAARVWQVAADDLDRYERDHALEALTIKDAARESGFSEAHLGRLLAEQKIENAGRKGAPRIRRSDLPKKPPARLQHHGEPDLVGRVVPNLGAIK